MECGGSGCRRDGRKQKPSKSAERSLIAAHEKDLGPRRIAFIGSSLPRQCGIATYTADLRGALQGLEGPAEFIQVAVTDAEPGYDYGSEVRYEIPEKEIATYRRVADFLNTNGIEAV